MPDPTTPPVFPTTDPATLHPGKSYPGHTAQDAATKAARAAEAQRGWRRTPFDERARLMRAAASVLRARRDDLAALMTSEMGDPRDPATRLGPLQSVAARDQIHAQVQESVAKGATLLLGGTVPDRPGAWYPATVLGNVRPGQPAHDDEVFGPVAAVIEAASEQEAIAIANASEFGLG